MYQHQFFSSKAIQFNVHCLLSIRFNVASANQIPCDLGFTGTVPVKFNRFSLDFGFLHFFHYMPFHQLLADNWAIEGCTLRYAFALNLSEHFQQWRVEALHLWLITNWNENCWSRLNGQAESFKCGFTWEPYEMCYSVDVQWNWVWLHQKFQASSWCPLILILK